MKRLLIVTYYWPPSGGAAVQRWLSFANKLTDRGHEVHLLTVDAAYATYQLRDDSLVGDVHPGIQVHTTKTVEPFGIFQTVFGKSAMPKPAFANENGKSFLKKVARFIRGNLFVPDPRKGWRRFAVKKATEVLSRQKFDCLITAGPPHSTHFIGQDLQKRFGLPWIADFHDLWTDVIYYNMLYHLPAVKRKDAALERSILHTADGIITVGDKYKQKLLSKSANLRPEKFTVLRIGYDEKLFASADEAQNQQAFVITYTGTLAGFYKPGVFIQALKTVVVKYPEVVFRLTFAGVLAPEVRQQIADAGLSYVLDDRGYVSHKASVALLQASTVLLLVNPVTADEEMVIPGKVYEYLAAGKPILNITKSGAETASLIKECNAGKTFERHQQPEVEGYLNDLVRQWKERKTLEIRGNAVLVQRYSRFAETLRLERLIGSLTEDPQRKP